MSDSTPDLIRVAVVGGGLSGLSATYELVRRARLDFLPLEIRLFEADDRLGGTIRSEPAGGFLLEHGPASFATVDDAALKLIAELGLQGELIPARTERGALVWWRDALHPIPPGLVPPSNGNRRALLSSTLLSKRGRARVALEQMIPRRRLGADESIAAFVTRRFGREMLERVGEPLLAGAVGGDADHLGARYAAPWLIALEREHGSVTRGLDRLQERDVHQFGIARKAVRSTVVSFRRGVETLVDGLAAAIERDDIDALRRGQRVVALRPAGDPVGAAAYELKTADGDRWVADICVLAVPAREASRLVQDFAPEVAEALASIRHASTLDVYLGYGRGPAGELPEAMECLIPAAAQRPALSCSLVHQQFDYRVPPGGALLRVRMGGERNRALIDWEDDTAVRAACREVRDLFGIDDEPALTRVVRRQRAFPQYRYDHGTVVKVVERELDFHSGLMLAGRSLYGLTVAEIIDNGRATAATVSDVARTRLT